MDAFKVLQSVEIGKTSKDQSAMLPRWDLTILYTKQ
jgi:hypothetical protein